jgi:hypothetical protein
MVFGMPLLAKTGVFPDLSVVQQKLQSSGKVYAATVSVGKSWNRQKGVTQQISFFQSTAIFKERPMNYEAAAGEIAAIILATYPEIAKEDDLMVSVFYGYDIGIAHAWIRSTFQHSPQQWMNILGSAKQENQPSLPAPASGTPATDVPGAPPPDAAHP